MQARKCLVCFKMIYTNHPYCKECFNIIKKNREYFEVIKNEWKLEAKQVDEKYFYFVNEADDERAQSFDSCTKSWADDC